MMILLLDPTKKLMLKASKIKVYYTSLRENTNIEVAQESHVKNRKQRVSSSDDRLINPVKLKGRIKINNPLRLPVKEVDVETILDNLDIIKNKSIIKDKDLVKELIKDLKFEIDKRDYVIDDTPNISTDELEIINRSKSYVVERCFIKTRL